MASCQPMISRWPVKAKGPVSGPIMPRLIGPCWAQPSRGARPRAKGSASAVRLVNVDIVVLPWMNFSSLDQADQTARVQMQEYHNHGAEGDFAQRCDLTDPAAGAGDAQFGDQAQQLR